MQERQWLLNVNGLAYANSEWEERAFLQQKFTAIRSGHTAGGHLIDRGELVNIFSN